MRTIVCPVPPRDEEAKRVVIKTTDPNEKLELSVAEAHLQGYCEYTTDDRGFINSIIDCSGESLCPPHAISVSPLWLQHQH